ncbi:hypothetical protein ACNR90_004157 [Candidozyma auris]
MLCRGTTVVKHITKIPELNIQAPENELQKLWSSPVTVVVYRYEKITDAVHQ